MKKRRAAMLVTVAVGALAACGNDDNDVQVDWDAYPPGLQERIDELVDLQDCAVLGMLLAEVIDADDNGGAYEPTRNMDESKMQQYGDRALTDAGCPQGPFD